MSTHIHMHHTQTHTHTYTSSLQHLNVLRRAGRGPPALRVQIRVRKYVYRVSMNNLPQITAKPGQSVAQEAERLRIAFVELVKVPLPAKQHSPTPFPVRGAIPAPSAEAVKLEKDHNNQVLNSLGSTRPPCIHSTVYSVSTCLVTSSSLILPSRKHKPK
jgi:hypothetical protein